ncbi:hypothetical protein N7512_002387 [Penicillium capsulatum]|nr:hypothetical protein N7512_002387 [Penicillium capsulatum]
MALLSRSSPRGSVRQAPDHSDGAKKLRVQENGSRRRRSSPDCLDTSVTHSHAESDPTRLANPLKSARPRTSTRRTRRSSSASVDCVTPSARPTTSETPRANVNGLVDGSDERPAQGALSSAASVEYLHDERESPDPLDTISPAVNRPTKVLSPAPKVEPKPTTPSVATRAARRNDIELKADTMDTPNEKTKDSEQLASPRPADAMRSLRTRKNALPETEQPASAPGARRDDLCALQTRDPEAPKPELLAASTKIALVDDISEPLLPSPDPSPFGNPLQKLHNCEVITLPEPVLRSAAVDPLNDEMYFRVHRRFERQEKQLRNIERDRAQHEKQNVDRLLEELRGPDWLRIMGLTGVHDSEKKLYEPKRQILIQELVAVVKKFQVWKDDERRRKLGKDKPPPVVDTEPDARRPRKQSRPVEDATDGDGSPVSGIDSPSTPDPNDVDAWAARQLHQEARSASAAKPRKSGTGSHKARVDQENVSQSKETPGNSKRQKTQHPPRVATPVYYYEPPSDKPFTSFFDEPQAREAAIAASKGPREGRPSHILAFGHPIPNAEEHEFEPPPALLTEEFLRASQRQRRRLKRQSQG